MTPIDLPALLGAAAQSVLGIVGLVVIAVAALVWILFRNEESSAVRLGVFFVSIVGAGLLAGAVLRVQTEGTDSLVSGTGPPSAPEEELDDPVVPAASDSASASRLSSSEAKRLGERLTARWLDALQGGDLDRLVLLSGLPFFFDERFVTTPAQLRSRYRAWIDGVGPDLAPPDRILSYTLAEYREQGFADTDRIVGRLELDDTDIVVGVVFAGEGIAFFFRNFGGRLELVGLWD